MNVDDFASYTGSLLYKQGTNCNQFQFVFIDNSYYSRSFFKTVIGLRKSYIIGSKFSYTFKLARRQQGFLKNRIRFVKYYKNPNFGGDSELEKSVTKCKSGDILARYNEESNFMDLVIVLQDNFNMKEDGYRLVGKVVTNISKTFSKEITIVDLKLHVPVHSCIYFHEDEPKQKCYIFNEFNL